MQKAWGEWSVPSGMDEAPELCRVSEMILRQRFVSRPTRQQPRKVERGLGEKNRRSTNSIGRSCGSGHIAFAVRQRAV